MQEHDVVETLIYTSSINQGKQYTFDLIYLVCFNIDFYQQGD